MSEWFWPIVLIAALALVIIAEIYAFVRPDGTTLSAYINAASRNGIIPFFAGMLVGGLAVHFWLPWCPPT